MDDDVVKRHCSSDIDAEALTSEDAGVRWLAAALGMERCCVQGEVDIPLSLRFRPEHSSVEPCDIRVLQVESPRLRQVSYEVVQSQWWTTPSMF